jgi:hypothetical protein
VAQTTEGERAVLTVVAERVKATGRCDITMSEIAGRAGVCHRLAQTTIRLAESLGWLSVTERKLSAFRNDTNVIVIRSSEWLAWLRVGKGVGAKKFIPRNTNTLSDTPGFGRAWERYFRNYDPGDGREWWRPKTKSRFAKR